MKFNSLPNKCKYFIFCFPSGDAAGKIRNVSSVGGRTFFNNDKISHVHSPRLFQTGLLQRAVQCTRWYVYARLSCDRNRAALRQMMKLTMTSFGTDQKPAISFNYSNEFMDFHSEKSTSLTVDPHNVRAKRRRAFSASGDRRERTSATCQAAARRRPIVSKYSFVMPCTAGCLHITNLVPTFFAIANPSEIWVNWSPATACQYSIYDCP